MRFPRLSFLLTAAVTVVWSQRAHAQNDPHLTQNPAPSPTPSASSSAQPPPAAPPTPAPPTPPPTSAQPAPAPAEPPRASQDTRRPTLMQEPPTSGVDPNRDAQQLAAQGQQRPPSDVSIGAKPTDVFSDDWWGRARPIIELHGYFRTRGELFHNFSLGRHDTPGDIQHLWPQPLDQSYADRNGQDHAVNLCDPNANSRCIDKTQASANLRFRLNPEIHISDNLRIMSQIDMLDNLVLGSTPDAYAMGPSTTAGSATAAGASGTNYAQAGYNRNATLSMFSTTQGSPTAGVNSYQNAINVNRVWGEYQSPVGQLRFGRMPGQWGLGMVQNSGDGIDSDYQTTTDRIMFVTGLKSLDLYFGGSWDFVSTGPTSASPYDLYGGQPYSTCNLCNVNEWALFVAHRTDPALQKLQLAHNDVVINGGLYTTYRAQVLDVASGTTPLTADYTKANNGLEVRNARALVPDLWVQVLWRKLRVEGEFASVFGDIQNSGVSHDTTNPVQVREYGLTTQSEFRAIEDKLRMGFGFGWASGDPWAPALSSGSSSQGLNPELNGRGPISTFSFHPDYRVDLIFFRQILQRVEGAYYFRPSVDYDFLRQPNGQKLGGGAAIIWSRASEFVQTPGHKRDLGVELDVSLYYQAKDGSLNDDPEKVGGFFAMVQYGVFFPLGGLSYLAGQQTNAIPDWSTSSAQTVRLFLGIMF